MDEISWCSLQNMGLMLSRLRKEGLQKFSPGQRGPEVVALGQGIVMTITGIEIIDAEAVVGAGKGMIVAGIARGAEIEIIAEEVEATP